MNTATTDPFAYAAPDSVQEASRLLSRYGAGAKLIAGGHSLVPMMKLGLVTPEALIDLRKIESIRGIKSSAEGINIGGATTYRELETSDEIAAGATAISDAACEVADTQVRNWGTIGGSLAHADPAGDMPAVALALEFNINLASARAERTVPADRFFRGYFTTALRHNEVLTSVDCPALPAGSGSAYIKLANKASHYAVVGIAAVITMGDDGLCSRARLAITGAGPNATRSRRAERILEGKGLADNEVARACARAGVEVDIFNDDVHASGEYRAAMVRVFARRAINLALERATSN